MNVYTEEKFTSKKKLFYFQPETSFFSKKNANFRNGFRNEINAVDKTFHV